MGEKYRVTVERITESVTVDPSQDLVETIIELTASREQLARFAPGVVAEALGAPTAVGNVITSGFAQGTFTQNTSGGPAPAAGETAEPVKRTRRTKAQIEADKAAAEASASGGTVTRDEPGEVTATPGQTAPQPAATPEPYNPFIR